MTECLSCLMLSQNRGQYPQRRPRKSSSEGEGEGENRQPAKKPNMAEQVGANCSSGQTVYTSLDGEPTMTDIMSMLKQINSNQEALRQSVEQRLVNMEIKLHNQISTCVSDLRDSIDMDMASMKDRLAQVENQLKDCHEANHTKGTETPLQSQCKLIIKNVPENEDETVDMLRMFVDNMISAIDSSVPYGDIVRLGQSSNASTDSRRPRPVAITVSNSDRSSVLRNKRLLRDKPPYNDVYIEPDRSRHERITEANIRNIVRSLPNLEFKRGKIVHKE